MLGFGGRMGQEIVKAISEKKNLQIAGGVDRKKSAGPVRIETKIEAFTEKQVDVVIDFSSPELFRSALEWCVKNKRPLVSGTTGLTADDFKKLRAASKSTPALWAPNMSLGVAMMSELVKKVAQLDDFDFQIEEFHHRHKKDKPSGTALFLQEQLKAATSREIPEIVSVRGGGIYGIHRLSCMSPDETLTIEHVALNRSVFAKGAVTAAQWLVAQKPGLYELKNTLAER